MASAAIPRRRVRIDLAIATVVGLLIVVLGFGATVSDRFATTANLLTVAEQAAALGFVAIGQTLAVLVGGIDLSVGAMVTAANVFVASFVHGSDVLMIPGLVAVLVLGAAIGLVNGIVTVRTGVHPLIVTLGTASILNGLVLLYTLQPTGKVPAWFEDFAYDTAFGLPIAGLVFLIAAAIVALVLARTGFGRAVYAVGGNYEAARLAGLPAERVTLMVYAASGFFAALAGAYYVSRTGTGDPRVGDPMTLASITPVVVGGTQLGGGKGGILGTVLGVLLISLVNNLLNYMNVSTFIQWVVQGLIIITAVSLFVNRGKRL